MKKAFEAAGCARAKQIEDVGVKNIDAFCLYENTLNFFKCEIGEENLKQGTSPATLETIMKKGRYELIVISLRSDNLKKLVLGEKNVILLLKRTCPKATVFIFGGRSVLKKVRKLESSRSIYTYERHGVAKLTQKFKEAIIAHIETVMKKKYSMR